MRIIIAGSCKTKANGGTEESAAVGANCQHRSWTTTDGSRHSHTAEG